MRPFQEYSNKVVPQPSEPRDEYTLCIKIIEDVLERMVNPQKVKSLDHWIVSSKSGRCSEL